jgi:D-alanine-D-alanine ligase
MPTVSRDGRIRVAVVYGGRSSEHDISLMSGASVLAALDPERYDVVPVQIGREGGWQLESSSMLALEPGADSRSLIPAGANGSAVVPAEAGPIDVVMPILHGPFGEDGTIQGLLEMLGLPYVGSGVLGSSLTMDKDAVKMVLRSAGIAVASSVAFRQRRWSPDLVEPLGYPCFVKPARLGSSVGISKVHSPDELEAAMELAFQHDSKVLVEEFIQGREVEIGVLGNTDPIVSVPGEILIANDSEWYDYSAKYDEGAMQLAAPAHLDAGIAEEIGDIARRAFEVCECAGMARIDFFVTPENLVVLNEINAIPGFTATSVYAKLFEASGIGYSELLDRLVTLALERHAEESSYRH